MALPIITAEEAASHIKNGATIGLSGFTASGAPKDTFDAVAAIATAEHEAGRPYKVSIFTGASTNKHVDGALSLANAIDRRAPYQNTPDLRKRINSHDAHYFDLHLSEMAQKLRYGFYGPMDFAVIEAVDVRDDGRLVLGTGAGISPTIAAMADKIIIELNSGISRKLEGLHDLYLPADPPYRREIPIYNVNDRIGSPYLYVDPKKVIGVVPTNVTDGVKPFTALDETSEKIGANVCEFLVSELRAGRLPKGFLPLQSGVGNVANAVLYGLADATEIPPFTMYTEVAQDAVLDLMERDRCKFVSTCSLTMSDEAQARLFAHDADFCRRICIRPSELSNNPEIIRRLGVIAMNTALEADIFGAINSTHVLGTKMMNGIGGSGDFTRNSYLSIFSCPSVSKGGLISNIVPMVAHQDHSEHSVDVLITDQGVADLRGKDPVQRAEIIIENCAHPDYKPLLRAYLAKGKGGQTPHILPDAFAFHNAFNETGDMRNAKL
ncbi:MAG: succinate CoA transferase [Muribaculaceae bacterium]|nr:succinate CoA transferase [Bacteroidales bacterium]MBD5325575.1 succinate CoA transferase [Bacteroides sp.]MDE6223094.1 succinate CoA transferase [Muribaculaceae bacterium]MBD5327049.1 succinate CoA transferase [Bacteroides sp.]MBD5425048.1 succinate CoA transferase [Bacteroides sp.]